jgi:hypothetical protein
MIQTGRFQELKKPWFITSRWKNMVHQQSAPFLLGLLAPINADLLAKLLGFNITFLLIFTIIRCFLQIDISKNMKIFKYQINFYCFLIGGLLKVFLGNRFAGSHFIMLGELIKTNQIQDQVHIFLTCSFLLLIIWLIEIWLGRESSLDVFILNKSGILYSLVNNRPAPYIFFHRRNILFDCRYQRYLDFDRISYSVPDFRKFFVNDSGIQMKSLILNEFPYGYIEVISFITCISAYFIFLADTSFFEAERFSFLLIIWATFSINDCLFLLNDVLTIHTASALKQPTVYLNY